MENCENIRFSIGMVDRFPSRASIHGVVFLLSFRLSTAKSMIFAAVTRVGPELVADRIGRLEERSWVALDVVLGVRLPNLYREISVWAGNPSRSLRASRLGYRELYAIGLSKAYSLIQELINELE